MTIFYSHKYASFVPRFVAALIDWLIQSLPLPLGLLYFAYASNLTEVASRFIMYVTLFYVPWSIAVVFYYVIGLSRYGKTIGKAVVGLEVATASGAFLSKKMSLFRELIAKAVSYGLVAIGMLAMIFTKDQRAWHDLLADTYVYKKNNRLVLGILVVLLMMAVYGALYYMLYTVYRGNTALQQNLNAELRIPLLP
jgi:uncharacterized RDD family membrane protein YckC